MAALNCSRQIIELFIFLILCECLALCNNIPKLLLISMDGFRYNYLDNIPQSETENFHYFIRNGVKAKSIKSVFPTVTYPNHYSLITGLYPESHGVVHNRFYDTDLEAHFWYDDIRDNLDPLWYDVGAEPIYVTNHKAGKGRKSGSVLWPTGIGKVKCVGPDRIIPHANAFTHMNFTERVDHIIDWFSDKDDPINVGLLYFDEPDETAHEFGPESKEVRDLITGELNSVLGYLIKSLKDKGLQDSVNIVLTADHGFTPINNKVILEDQLNISWLISSSNFTNGVTELITPAKGKEEEVYEALKNVPNITVFRKGDDDLKALHYNNNNNRITPFVITADEGTVILKDKMAAEKYKTKGGHGYNPLKYPDMQPFFLAVGPAFRKNYVADTFNNVDVYELMCHVLGINPAPNNGSLEHVLHFLVDSHAEQELTYTITGISFLILVGIAVSVASLYTICACHNARSKQRFILPSGRGSNHARGKGIISLNSPEHHLLQMNEDDDDDDEF